MLIYYDQEVQLATITQIPCNLERIPLYCTPYFIYVIYNDSIWLSLSLYVSVYCDVSTHTQLVMQSKLYGVTTILQQE